MVASAQGVILARGGSKGIPGKNLVNFLGKPLIDWTILQMFEAGISNVYVSTDSEKIAQRAAALGASPIRRPYHLATDTSPGDHALVHAVRKIGCSSEDEIVLAQATSPVRLPVHLAEALAQFTKGGLDSLVSCVEFSDIGVWSNDKGELSSITYDHLNRKNRQEREGHLVENGSFYISRAGLIVESGNRMSGRIGSYSMPPWTLHEIDVVEDLAICEVLMQRFVINKEI